MHDVSKAINNIDPSGATDRGICKKNWVSGSGSSSYSSETDGKCNSPAQKASMESTFDKLSDMFDYARGTSNSITRKYPDDADTKMSEYPKTSATISKDVSTLNREQHGVVSSAFAKAHEGAEIVEIRSIS
ncbi:hypothetical protein, partial [Anaplasma bovis]|uniref:hypothetical protein n=1 Tax=Anaplasma bovis TaxID=186733 RepID=UPI002FF409BD